VKRTVKNLSKYCNSNKYNERHVFGYIIFNSRFCNQIFLKINIMKASCSKKGTGMTGLLLVAVLLLSLGFTAYENSITGSGMVVRELRETSPFSSVSVSSAIKLVLTQGSVYEVVVSADDNLLPLVVTKVSGSTLNVGLEPLTSLRRYKEIVVYVTAPEIHSISCSGASEVNATNALSQESLTIKSSGASEVNLRVDARYLKVEGSGASEITMEGSAGSLMAKISGASEMKSYGLNCLIAEVELSGASNMRVSADEKVIGKASGASSLCVKGNASVNVRTSGASSVAKR
jgi:hypothetical protein